MKSIQRFSGSFEKPFVCSTCNPPSLDSQPFTSNDELKAYLIKSEQYPLNPGPDNRYIMGTIFERVVELVDKIEGLREEERPGEWWKKWTFKDLRSLGQRLGSNP